jgi:hypothetical protein
VRAGPKLGALLVAVALAWSSRAADGAGGKLVYSKEARLEAVRHAQVWMPSDVRSRNIKTGPPGPGAFAPNETVRCDYVAKKMSGHSPKFICRITGGDDPAANDEVKVKYGRDNGEVFGEVAATRLLWALGFGADRMYPVHVVCRGCPPVPTAEGGKPGIGETTFKFAAIEREMEGRAIVTDDIEGWTWPELDLVDESAGGAPRAQRDALALLAVILQHTDSKAEQQRLVCLPDGSRKAARGSDASDAGVCPHPFMMINDLGLTFGHSTLFNRNNISSVNFDQWSKTPVWFDAKHCVGNLSQSQTGTLAHPVISEAGRKFLAGLLIQLSDAQLHDLFGVARLQERIGPSVRSASVDEWVEAFRHKRDEVVGQICP